MGQEMLGSPWVGWAPEVIASGIMSMIVEDRVMNEVLILIFQVVWMRNHTRLKCVSGCHISLLW